MQATANRPRTAEYGTGGNPITSVRLTEETREGFQEIRRLFQSRFPKEKCPTLSACLEVALAKVLQEGLTPEILRDEVQLFRDRYNKGVQV